MIGIKSILEWLRTFENFSVFDYGYCGKLDNKKEKAFAVYPLKQSGTPYRAFQGLESYSKSGVSLLMHFNKNFVETQEAALNIFNTLNLPYAHELATVDGHKVIYIDLLVPEPVFVGTDNNGIYEFIIEFEIYYKKEIDE